jgi:hypothetical protein
MRLSLTCLILNSSPTMLQSNFASNKQLFNQRTNIAAKLS